MLAEVVGLGEQVVLQEGVEGADWRMERVSPDGDCNIEDPVSRNLQPGVLELERKLESEDSSSWDGV